MKFIRKGKYYEVTEPSGYTVSASRLNNEWRFSAWRLSDRKNLGVYKSVELAREVVMLDSSVKNQKEVS
ncbi:MAG TPA: hypothetical protein DCL39_16000 [Alteromonas macleodii]|nr:hypothetical protein [Alteromonas macleodii]HAG30965.1 hypothetical protein [Alteromonas macleodii]HAM18057.1 hypothetical protein [Alteromonas macleodii]|tara:strand:- start:1298 stop:1504 length:207 start_codon:yes stop_codon:yes gene_type:complete